MIQQNQSHWDFTFLSQGQLNGEEDFIDRAIRELKIIQNQNNQIRNKIKEVDENPHFIINPIRNDIASKINQLREQNDSLKRFIENSKYPGYAQMTKKKIIVPQRSPWKKQREIRQSSFVRRRDNNDEIMSNYSKNDRSTCLNFIDDNECQTLREVEPLSHQDNRIRQAMISQLRFLMTKYEIFKKQLETLDNKNSRQQRSQEQIHILKKIEVHKKKLLKFLNKLKLKETNMKDLIKTYRQMHEQTTNKLKEATQVLSDIQDIEIDADIDEKYAQVLELEERLKHINAKLDQMNDNKWMSQILKQLKHAMSQVGLELPPRQSIKQSIQQICQLIIDGFAMSEKDTQAKLYILKEYHEQEKKNHQKTINALKGKQQMLAKRLLDMQLKRQ